MVEVDVWRFRAAVAVGDLELAARMYAGDLLPACYDDRVLEERERLRAEAGRVLVELAERSALRDDHEGIVRQCHRILDHEPTNEVAVRLLMEAHVAQGDRAAAMRAYHRCVETLERELEVEPGEALTAIYRSLRADPSGADGDAGWDVTPAAESPFVGREPELEQMRSIWASVREGRSHVVVIEGEPGIGKSRLAAEIGRRIRAEGHVAVAARAFEAAGRLPWAPVVDLLRSEEIRRRLESLEPVFREQLGRLLPELIDTFRPGEPSGGGDLAQRYRLFDAASRALVGVEPRLFIVDDLQWCDADTLELIGYLVRAHREAPLLVIGTLRPEEVDDGHPLGGVTSALGREDAVTTLSLPRLDKAETAALTARIEKSDAVGELAARIWEETDGNPLFVIESLRARRAGGDGHAMLTPTMRSVLLGRLDQLPEGARRVAEVAAVIGRPFSVPLVVSVTGLSEDAVVDHVDELWRRRIVHDLGPTCDFSHDKIRAVALETVSPARRRQLHRGVAKAMLAEGVDADAVSAQLAAHYDQAGMVGPAIEAYQRAGAQAVAVSSLDEAVAMFRRALTVLADIPPSRDRDELELELRVALGSPLVALKGYGTKEAHWVYERAQVLCRKLGRPVDPPVLRGLGLARLQGCRFDDAAALGQALVDHEHRDPVTRTEGYYLLGVSAFWRGDLAGARRSLGDALESYDPSRRDEHLTLYAQDPRAVCLVRLAWTELWAGDPEAADGLSRTAVELARDLDHQMTSAYVVTYAAVVAAEAEDLDQLGALLEELDSVWRRLPMPYLMILGDALRGWLELSRGSTDGIERLVRSVGASRAEGEVLHLTYCLLLLARARYMLGEVGHGRAATTEAFAQSQRGGQHYLEAELWKTDGELAYRGGETDDAAESLRRGAALAEAQEAGWLELRVLHSLLTRFEEPEARRQLERLVETLPSGHDLPAFQAAIDLLATST
jgi:tetratricopeptide (TPR) repeat protein